MPPDPHDPIHPSLLCLHGRPVTLPAGPKKCLDCGSIEGYDKVWRHAEVLWPQGAS